MARLYKHVPNAKLLTPMGLSHSEIQFLIKNKMRQGLTYEEASKQVYGDNKCVFRQEVIRVTNLRKELKDKNKNFKQNFKQLLYGES